MSSLPRRLALLFPAVAVIGGALLSLGSTAGPAAQALPRVTHGDPVADALAWAEAGQEIEAATAVPGAWCGDFRAADNTANEVAQGGPKWHVVIAVPSDVAANPAYQTLGQRWLADDAFRSVKILENFYTGRLGAGRVGETPYGWTLRFDYGTNCGAPFPDISFYHLPKTAAQYTTEPFFGVAADLDASNLYEAANKRYLVHYVGPSIYCGQSYIYSPTDNSGGAKYSITYNFDDPTVAPATGGIGGGVYCDWTTDAHEMGHSLGAATGGPLNNDAAHTWDCTNDVMSYGGPVCGDGVLYFDWQEDNYFSHPGGWNDTDLSAYWCKPNC